MPEPKKKRETRATRAGRTTRAQKGTRGTGLSTIGTMSASSFKKRKALVGEQDQESEVAFISNEVRGKLLELGKLPEAPSTDAGVAAILFVDISGFTDLGKRLRRDLTPERATEALADEIFGALARLTDICVMWGGDVAKFAGDALLCVWKVEPLNEESPLSRHFERKYQPVADIDSAMRLARRAAFEMLKGIKVYCEDLELHGGIGAGNLLNYHLGTDSEQDSTRWHLVTGSACVEAGDLIDESPKGSIYYVDTDADGKKSFGEITRETKIEESTALFEQELATVSPPLAPEEWIEKVNSKDVLAYIPKALQNKLKGGGIVGGEVLHKVSVMFIGLQHLQLTQEELSYNRIDFEKLHKLNDVFNTLINIVHSFGGEIRDLLFDDKGCIFIAVFGAHEGLELSALKCVRAATSISKGISKSKIGITVGSCFTGMCGTHDRHDFVVMGHEVNLASRFSSIAEQGQILVSENVRKATHSFVDYEATTRPYFKKRPVTLEDGSIERRKVKVAEFQCYLVQNEVNRAASFIVNFRGGSVRLKTESNIFVGRDEETHQILNVVTDPENQKSKTVLITGEPGIGKSALVKQIRQTVMSFSKVVFGAGFQIEQNTSCFAIRQLIGSLMDIDDPINIEQPALAAKLAQLGVKVDNSTTKHIFPNAVKGHRSNQRSTRNILTGSKGDDSRSQRNLIRAMHTTQVNEMKPKHVSSVTTFFKNLVASQSRGGNIEVVVFLEDIQWLDVNSFDILLELISNRIPNVVFILSARSSSSINDEARQRLEGLISLLKKIASAATINLEPMSKEETGELCAKLIVDFKRKDAEVEGQGKGLKILGMDETDLVSQSVKDVVYERTKGLPRHIILLVRWLIESKNVTQHSMNGFDFANKMSQLQAENVVPESVAETIVMRLNILTGDARNVLKIAAGLEDVFFVDDIYTVLENDGSKISLPELSTILLRLKESGFIEPFQKQKGFRMRRMVQEWQFVSDVTKSAVKSLLPEKRRVEIQEMLGPAKLPRKQSEGSMKKKGLGKFFSM
mmetsp:Transcript_9289/g.10713  ORF Transcript_9289/g.10713 Transcript_9289/m.10713 type:complete len:1028 (-) Transcript_9289:173-3256(-)